MGNSNYIITEIERQISTIESAIEWGENHSGVNTELLTKKRRAVRRIKNALTENCSAAAYGESQVGKSYLMSSILSTPDKPFVIRDGEKEYSFIDQINSSGGERSQTESTGVITRFTIREDMRAPEGFVRVKLLSVADLILMLCDSYYNDVDREAATISNDSLTKVIKDGISKYRVEEYHQQHLSCDDVLDIYDYTKQVIRAKAQHILDIDFGQMIAKHIEHIQPENWVHIFSFLWDDNEQINRLFSFLINEYQKLEFKSLVYVPFRALLREYGTILKVEWLDHIFSDKTPEEGSKEELLTDVYAVDNLSSPLQEAFRKAALSALTAEITFALPPELAEERSFLKELDLLDFPGARTRLQIKDEALSEMLPQVLRRGKVAYLFNKYSRALMISSVLFCHHNDQRTEPGIGASISKWIQENIGRNPQERATFLETTEGISPLFFIATKFNIELERNKMDAPGNKEKLSEHWKHFDRVIPEIIESETWFSEWVERGTNFPSSAFQAVYPLRDFYWSGKNKVFVGYSDGECKSPETGYYIHSDYPDFMDELKDSFLSHPFVKEHFRNPIETWENVATPNKDGSGAIIKDLNKIAPHLQKAREVKYLKELKKIKMETLAMLEPNYESEDKQEENERVKNVAYKVRCSLASVMSNPKLFGNTIDTLMIPQKRLQSVVYDLLILRTERPKEVIAPQALHQVLQTSPDDDPEVIIQRAQLFFGDQWQAMLQSMGVSIEKLTSNQRGDDTSLNGLVAERLLSEWYNFLLERIEVVELGADFLHEVVPALIFLAKKKELKEEMSRRIGRYRHTIKEYRQPTVIADYATILLNNLVANVGSNLLTEEDKQQIEGKAVECELVLFDQPLEPLHTDDDHIKVRVQENINKNPSELILKNYQQWQNNVIDCLLLSAGTPIKDPIANRKLGAIIKETSTLYTDKSL